MLYNIYKKKKKRKESKNERDLQSFTNRKKSFIHSCIHSTKIKACKSSCDYKIARMILTLTKKYIFNKAFFVSVVAKSSKHI